MRTARRLVVWLLLAWPVRGWAQETTVPELAERIRTIVRSPAPQAGDLDAVLADLDGAARALPAPVDDDLWVDLLLDLTVARFQLGQDWRAPRTAAAWARPDRRPRVGPMLAELLDWDAPPRPVAAPLPFGRTVWLDGRRLDQLPALAGLHLLQGERCGAWRSALVEGAEAEALRAGWYAPCPTPAWRGRDRALVAAGGALVVAGAATAAATYAAARPGLDQSRVPEGDGLSAAQRATLRGANAAGWAAAAVGAGLTAAGTWLRVRHVRGARARR